MIHLLSTNHLERKVIVSLWFFRHSTVSYYYANRKQIKDTLCILHIYSRVQRIIRDQNEEDFECGEADR